MKTLIRKTEDARWVWSVLKDNHLIGWGSEASQQDAEEACNTFVEQKNLNQ
jgi:hypothetical protein